MPHCTRYAIVPNGAKVENKKISCAVVAKFATTAADGKVYQVDKQSVV